MVLKAGVAKWLCGAPYNQPLAWERCRDTKVGRHIYWIQTNKKASRSHTIKPTGSPPFWLEWWNFGDCWRRTFALQDYRINPSNLKFGLCHVETFRMKTCIQFCRILNALAVAALQSLMFRHKTGSVYISSVHGPIWPKFLMFDKSPGPNISACQYWVILIAPPSGNRKLQIS